MFHPSFFPQDVQEHLMSQSEARWWVGGSYAALPRTAIFPWPWGEARRQALLNSFLPIRNLS
jgi:hypothetical protein